MTTKWEVPKSFEGGTVAVLASGPSMTRALADSVRQYPRIVCRRAFRFAPDADMLMTLDGPLDAECWEESVEFDGPRVIGYEDDGVDAMFLSVPHERVTLGEGHVLELRNNGFAAIRAAAMGNPSKILLLGFDRDQYDARENNVAVGWRGFEEGLDALTAELRARGIEVERVGDTALAAEPGESRPPFRDDVYIPAVVTLDSDSD